MEEIAQRFVTLARSHLCGADHVLQEFSALVLHAEQLLHDDGIEVAKVGLLVEPRLGSNPRPSVRSHDGQVVNVAAVFEAPCPSCGALSELVSRWHT